LDNPTKFVHSGERRILEGDMYRTGALTVAALSATISQAMAFDTAAYCASVSKAVGGSYSIEASCHQSETAAMRSFEQAPTEPTIREYCTSVGDAVGGSYSIALSCIENETAAKEKVDAMIAGGLDPRIQSYCTEVADAVGSSFSIMESCIQQELGAKAKLGQ
jgi:hypothetical protein